MYPRHLISEEEFYYRPLSAEALVHRADEIKKSLDIIISIGKKKYSTYSMEIRINYPAIYRIIERIDQRRDYYMYFHSRADYCTKMSQSKEVALMSYWILKYRPFSFKSEREEARFFSENGYSFNEYYVSLMLIAFIVGLDVSNKVFFTDYNILTLTYSLVNRELSKEAFILYVESFLRE